MMTKYLVNTEHRTIIGACVFYQYSNGWRFLPHVTSHRGSRKHWPTWESCIPAWAKRAAGTNRNVLTKEEALAQGLIKT